MGIPGADVPMGRPRVLVAACVLAWILGGFGLMCNACGLFGAAGSGMMGQMMASRFGGEFTAQFDARLQQIDGQIRVREESGEGNGQELEELKAERARIEAAKERMKEAQPRFMNTQAWVSGLDGLFGLGIAVLALAGGLLAFRGMAAGLRLILVAGGLKIVLAAAHALVFVTYVVPVQMEFMEAAGSLSGPPGGAGGAAMARVQTIQKGGMMIWTFAMAAAHIAYCAVMAYLATRREAADWCRAQEPAELG